MAALVTLAHAKIHLKIDDDDHNADVKLKIDQASAAIIRYLKSRADPTWTEATVPGDVQAATMLLVGYFYEHRGEDIQPGLDVWTAIERLLVGRRDPALA